MSSRSLRPWFVLRAIPGVGDAILLKLVQSLGTPDSVLAATPAALEEIGCRPPLIEALRRGPDALAVRQLNQELTQLECQQGDGADLSGYAVSGAASNDP